MPNKGAFYMGKGGAELWEEFRVACIRHQKSASQALRELMQTQIDLWKEEQRRKEEATTRQ